MKFNLFKKKTREELVNEQSDSVFRIIVNSEDKFSELELVQIANNTRRILSDYLKSKKNENMEQSTNFTQKSIEIQTALDFME